MQQSRQNGLLEAERMIWQCPYCGETWNSDFPSPDECVYCPFCDELVLEAI